MSSPSPVPAMPPQISSPEDAIAASDDLLLEFFDFFDRTIDDVFAYVLHRTCVLELAKEVTMELYFSLLQRRRFFWWHRSPSLPALFSVADALIRKTAPWRQGNVSGEYLQTLGASMPGRTTEERVSQATKVLNAVNALPSKEQAIFILSFFLHWSGKQSALAFKMDRSTVEAASARVLQSCLQQLQTDPLFHGVDLASLLQKQLKFPTLEESIKAEMRVSILEKFRTAQVSSLRYVLPIAALLLVVTSTTGGIGYALVPPLSNQRGSQTVAAATSLLLNQERSLLNDVAKIESRSSALAAAFASRDMAAITVDLTGPAIDEQVSLEYEVYTMLRSFSTRALFSDRFQDLLAFVLPLHGD